MPPKRKSDLIATLDAHGFEPTTDVPAAKKARVEGVTEASPAEASGSKSQKKGKEPAAPVRWQDVVLEGEEEGDIAIYDDCNEIRRKIRLLLKEPGFKITHWLRELGGINNNSYSRFMKASGPTAGATNGLYPAAYKYFEKRRIAEGKKKTAKRMRNEDEYPNGLPLEDHRKMWFIVAA